MSQCTPPRVEYGMRAREKDPRILNFANYVIPSKLLLEDSGNQDRMMSGIFTKVATTLRYQELPSGKQVLLFPQELASVTAPYMWAKLALVDMPKDSTNSGSDTEEDEKNLRDLTDSLREMYKKFLDQFTVYLTCFRHPVDMAAHLIVAMAKAGPSKRSRDNVSVGCGMANLVLLGHQYPLITRAMQDNPDFVSKVMTCVDHELTDSKIQRVYSLDLRSYLESILAKSEKSCQACGITASEHKKNFPELGKLQVCGGCRAVVYCCRSCQQKDYSTHKLFCKENTVKKCIELTTDQGGKIRFHPTEILETPEAK